MPLIVTTTSFKRTGLDGNLAVSSDADIPFYNPSTEYKQYRLTTYGGTNANIIDLMPTGDGHIIANSWVNRMANPPFSMDNATKMTGTMVFSDQAAYETYLADPVIIENLAARTEYNSNNNIKTETITTLI